MYLHNSIVVEDPVDTTVCEGDSATFTCVIFFSMGVPLNPGWFRDGAPVNMTRHTVGGNGTGATAPVSVSGTVTVSNVTVVDDDGISYECGIADLSNNATLNVVGEYIFHDLMFPNV